MFLLIASLRNSSIKIIQVKQKIVYNNRGKNYIKDPISALCTADVAASVLWSRRLKFFQCTGHEQEDIKRFSVPSGVSS